MDSSVAACLLVKAGYEVIGISLKLLAPHRTCSGAGFDCRIEDARTVCAKLGIPFYALNYSDEFQEKVIKYFCLEYEKGRTPNPCVVCNKTIKFAALLQKAKALNTDYVATGHYVNTEYDKNLKRYILKKGKDKNKDQSYFLFSLTQKQLKPALFPLGNYTKEQVRRIARKNGLKIHNLPESQDVCFLSGRNYHEFLKIHLGDSCIPGLIMNSKGETVGEHKGIPFYTIGQRKGLGPHKKPMYVIRIDKEENVIVIGEEKELYKDSLIAENINWIGIKEFKKPFEVGARTRYRSKESKAVIYPHKDFGVRVKVKFAKPQRAITPGQAVVFYNKDIVLGGGWIK